jgi:hypothetical protein
MKFLVVQEWEEEEGAVREWGFLVGCKSGETKEGAGREGGFCWLPYWDIYCQRNPLANIEKSAPENIRVVFYNVRFVIVELIQF